MSCFWRELVDAFDPSCLNTTPIYAYPIEGATSTPFIPAFYSDNALEIPITASEAVIQQIDIYGATGGGCVSGCNPYHWFFGTAGPFGCIDYGGTTWGGGRSPENPPLMDTTNTFTTQPFYPFDPAIGFDPNAIPGYTAAVADAACPVILFTIGTDIGIAVFVFVDDCCH